MTTHARAGCIIFGRYNLADQRRIARLTVPIRATQQFSCDYGHFHFAAVTTLAGRVDRAGRRRGVGDSAAFTRPPRCRLRQPSPSSTRRLARRDDV